MTDANIHDKTYVFSTFVRKWLEAEGYEESYGVSRYLLYVMLKLNILALRGFQAIHIFPGSPRPYTRTRASLSAAALMILIKAIMSQYPSKENDVGILHNCRYLLEF